MTKMPNRDNTQCLAKLAQACAEVLEKWHYSAEASLKFRLAA